MSVDIKQHLPIIKHVAPDPATLTFGGAATTAVLWGFNVSDISMIVSSCVAVGGFLVQVWVARHRIKALQHTQIKEVARMAVAEALAATAEAVEARKSQTGSDVKSE